MVEICNFLFASWAALLIALRTAPGGRSWNCKQGRDNLDRRSRGRAVGNTLLLVLIALLTGNPDAAQSCPYPCWSEIVPSAAQYFSFYAVTEPVPCAPYQWTFPAPPQSPGAYESIYSDRRPCRYDQAEVYYYTCTGDHQCSSTPEAGWVYRNPTYLKHSVLTGPWKGIGMWASFEGTAPVNRGTLYQAVFYHDNYCYFARGKEFGFLRLVRGAAEDNNVYFYVEKNPNCGPAGTCRLKSTGMVVLEEAQTRAMPIPTHPNSKGERSWYYQAWLTSATTLRLEIKDPYTWGVQWSESWPVPAFFTDFTTDMWNGHVHGYMTATSQLLNALAIQNVTMNLGKIWVAK